MEFHFHPAKDRPRTALFLTFVLGMVLQFLWQWVPPATALVLWAVLLFSLRDFFCPSVYLFGEDGLKVEGLLRSSRFYPWQRFRAFVNDRNGLFLSPYKKRRASEGHRGLFLALSPEQRARAVNFCERLGLLRREQ